MSKTKTELSPEEKLLQAIFGGGSKSEDRATQPKEDENKASDTPEEWKKLLRVSAAHELPKHVEQHLSVLAGTSECQSILQDISQRVEKIDLVDNRLVFFVETYSGDAGKIVCSPPILDGIEHLPKAYAAILRVHGGFSFPDYGRDAFDSSLGGTTPVFLNGGEVFTMFEPESTEEEDFIVVIDTHQDWFVLDTQRTLSSGEPVVCFLSHGGSSKKTISMGYGIGGHYLRLIARTILGKEDPRLSLFRNI